MRYPDMERFPVSSTSLRSIGYDVKKKVLEVEFLSGRIYRYFGVPGMLLIKMLAARSIGWFFNRNVRERFEYAEV
ncbi:hypothetical protein BH09VER1_BH09VER1_24110 [soil metagenome]